MRPEDIFGVNAGKVWNVLKRKGLMNAQAISKESKLKTNEVFGALGWLGREGKIQIVNEKKKTLYKLIG